MKNFPQRLITGIILTGLIIGAVISGAYSFLLLFLIINLLGLREFYSLFQSAGISSRKIPGTFLSISIFITSALVAAHVYDWRILLINIPLAFIIFIAELYSRAEKPFQNLAFTFMGILYITVPFAFLISIAFFPYGQGIYHGRIMLGYFFIVWASDSGAYGLGKLIGKYPLFKRISPGKTWEGSAGGTLCALLIAYIASRFYTELNFSSWIIIVIIVIVMGTYGDLIKSMMKRSLNVKDSGTILPGHGGILDRFDAMLSSAPFIFIYLSVFS